MRHFNAVQLILKCIEQEWKCAYCGLPFGIKVIGRDAVHFLRPAADHFYPYSKGGPTEPWNLIAACQLCNTIKHAYVFQTIEEASHFVRAMWIKRENRIVRELPGKVYEEETMAEILFGQMQNGALLETSQNYIDRAMTLIPFTFPSGGFLYRQIAREGNVATFTQSKHNEIISWEVVILRKKSYPGENLKRQEYEGYPTSSEWGTYGWTFMSKERAFAKMDELQSGNQAKAPKERLESLPPQ